MEDASTWKFPRSISFEDVAGYMERLDRLDRNARITLDMSETVNIHSSFIGFLIHAKFHINKSGGRIAMLLSLTVEKILIMLNIIDFFAAEIVTIARKKTA